MGHHETGILTEKCPESNGNLIGGQSLLTQLIPLVRDHEWKCIYTMKQCVWPPMGEK